jgi:branched-chain amino acid transport system ATP-binding protein
MVRPRSGSVRIDGLEMDADQIASDAAVALVPESLDVFPDLTVEENLRLGCRNGTRARWKDALAEMARVYPIFERQGRRSGSVLSGGERKVMAIVRARLAHPKVLLVDEASAGLAPAMIQRTYKMLREAAASGVATVTAESQPGVCEAYSVRVNRLHRGEFVGGTSAGRKSNGNGD